MLLPARECRERREGGAGSTALAKLRREWGYCATRFEEEWVQRIKIATETRDVLLDQQKARWRGGDLQKMLANSMGSREILEYGASYPEGQALMCTGGADVSVGATMCCTRAKESLFCKATVYAGERRRGRKLWAAPAIDQIEGRVAGCGRQKQEEDSGSNQG